jgi:hypothetical protein
MVEATVAIGTTLIGIALMIAFLRESTATAVDGKQRHFGDYDRYQYGSNQPLSMLQQYDTDLRQPYAMLLTLLRNRKLTRMSPNSLPNQLLYNFVWMKRRKKS